MTTTKEKTAIEVKAYQCPTCGSLHKRARGVTDCVKKHEAEEIKEKARQGAMKAERERCDNLVKMSDSVRLEAESVPHIFELLVKYAKEYMGLDLNFTEKSLSSWGFSASVSNTHGCPIGGVTNWSSEKDKPMGYPGWYGRFEGTITPGEYKGKELRLDSIVSSTFSNGILGFLFKGFHTSCGCPGNPFDISGYMFLSDFPKILAKYDEYLTLSQKATDWHAERNSLIAKANEKFIEIRDKDSAYSQLAKEIAVHEKFLQELKDAKDARSSQLAKANSDYLTKMATPASEFDYDKDKFKELYDMFEKPHRW